jgi:Alpha-glutamyl/putrescinyl thymine pyrophosphorylase clade 2
MDASAMVTWAYEAPHETHLEAGMDFRKPEYRREVFLRFWEFHLEYRSHPGCVYYLMPYLRRELGWTDDQAIWYAVLNGCTQNPVTSYILHQVDPDGWRDPSRVIDFYYDSINYPRLAVDTDRRYHRHLFRQAVTSFRCRWQGAGSPARWAHSLSECCTWEQAWTEVLSIATFGRMSAWSMLDYLHCMGHHVEPPDLYLHDPGSRSHRNGLAIVSGHDEWDWHTSNPRFNGQYTTAMLAELTAVGEDLLTEMHRRAWGETWAPDVSRLTLESALCTYKGWHRPNRRYPNVYNDLLHDRIVTAEAAWPEVDLSIFWRARRECLPEHLMLERCPGDPGCVPQKQNHYRRTGQVIMMDHEWPCFRNDFNDLIRSRRV